MTASLIRFWPGFVDVVECFLLITHQDQFQSPDYTPSPVYTPGIPAQWTQILLHLSCFVNGAVTFILVKIFHLIFE